VISTNNVDLKLSMISKSNILLASRAKLSTSLEKYKPKTVYNLSSTIFTNQQYGTHSGTGPPILGAMNKNYWMFSLLEIHRLVCVKYISIIYIIYLLKYYRHFILYNNFVWRKSQKQTFNINSKSHDISEK